MKIFTKYLLALSLLTVLSACKKNELKKPADVSVSMDINRLPSSQGHLVFNSGYIRLANFSIEGTRQEGAPVSLSKSFSQGLKVNFNDSEIIADLALDVPQGNYTSLIIAFESSDVNDEPTIQVSGTYTNVANQEIPVLFQFLSSETFSIGATAENGQPQIVLDKNIPSQTSIKFDPIYWFDIVSINQWENASLSDVEGVMTIVITDGSNSNIYDIMSDRVDESTEGKFSN